MTRGCSSLEFLCWCEDGSPLEAADERRATTPGSAATETPRFILGEAQGAVGRAEERARDRRGVDGAVGGGRSERDVG